MSVVYMLKLEEEPESYIQNFTNLTKGVNQQVNQWILDKIKHGDLILELGCGPGALSIEMAKKGAIVTAIDSNRSMISHAQKRLAEENAKNNSNLKVEFEKGDVTEIKFENKLFDYIVTTFMLSELRPFLQQRFLKNAFNCLKPNGVLIIAEEFESSGIFKPFFKIKRWYYKRKLNLSRSGVSHPMKFFLNYPQSMGFTPIEKKYWKNGSIRVYAFKKTKDSSSGFYYPKPRPFTGIKAFLRTLRCILTGQIDQVSIEPGLYKSGNPSPESPIIVTANYEYTYIKVMRDLQGIDAWVLCLDSNGINVWCASRGENFGNEQLIEAVQNSGVVENVKTKTMILPQLSAGGISIPKLPKSFPFHIKFGPIWSKDLKTYLQSIPSEKPESMRVIKFSLSKRLEAGITHTTFLLRMFLLWPTLILLIPFLILHEQFGFSASLQILLALWVIFISCGMGIAILFPFTKNTRNFNIKGTIFGIISLLISLAIFIGTFQFKLIFIGYSLWIYWIAFFTTMSFSGYTMHTGVTEIQDQYPIFQKLFKILLYIALSITILGGILDWIL